VYDEIQQFGAEFERVGNVFAGSEPQAEVAILQSYDSHWAIDFQRHSQKIDYVSQITDFYRALQPVAQTIDIVSPDADLSRYKVVFAPALNVLSKATAARLIAYCENGGRLVLGPRSGMKDFDDALQTERQPGTLAASLGGHVDQFYALEKPVPVEDLTAPSAKKHGMATVWAETLALTAPDTSVLMRYGKTADGWVDGQPAAIARSVGKGSMVYLGATLDSGLMSTFVGQILSEEKVSPLLTGLPLDVELMQRVKANGDRLWILLNHGSESEHIELRRNLTDLLTEKSGTSVELPGHGVAVYMLEGAR
jgi:beta-galactosidase